MPTMTWRFFYRLKPLPGDATPYGKLLANIMGFVKPTPAAWLSEPIATATRVNEPLTGINKL